MKIQSIDDVREYVNSHELESDLAYLWEDALWDMDELNAKYDLAFFKKLAKQVRNRGALSQEEYDELFGE